MEPNTVAARALEAGETTSEHAVMTSATTAGRVLAVLGTLMAAIPSLISMISNTPLAETKWGAIAITILGAIVTVMGIAKETKAKVVYIEGRNLLKAAALRDVPPDTELKTVTGSVVDAPRL